MSNEKTIEVLLKLNDQMGKQLSVSTDAMERAAKAAQNLEKKTEGADAAQKEAAKSSSMLSGGLTSLTGTIAASVAAYISVTAAVGAYKAAITSVLQVGGDFEQSLANTKAILQPTEAEFRALAYSAQELGRTTVFTASEAGNAYTELGKLGFDTAQILAAGNDVLVLAAAANLDMATAATAAATVVRQFGLEASQTGEVVDIMAKAFSISALDAGNFTEAMQYVGPAARAAGISVSEASAALGVLADNGVQGSMAGTSLRRIIMELSNETSNASKVVRQFNPEAQTLSEKFEALQKAGIDNASATKLFRMEASTAAMILSSSAPKIEEYGDKLRYAEGGAKGFAKGVADIQLDTFQGDLKLAESNLEGVQIALFEAFGPSARKIVKQFSDKIDEVGEWISENEDRLDEWGRAAVDIFEVAAIAADGMLKILSSVNDAIAFIAETDISQSTDSKDMVQHYSNLSIELNRANKELEEQQKIFNEMQSKGMAGDLYQDDLDDAIAERTRLVKERNETYQKILKDIDTVKSSLALKIDVEENQKQLDWYNKNIEAIKLMKSETIGLSEATRRIAKVESERIKQTASGRTISRKGSSMSPMDSSIDVESMKSAESEAEKAAAKADEQYRKILRDREIAELDGQKKQLRIINNFWDDAIAIDKAGGAKHIAELEAMRQKAIDVFLSTGIEPETPEQADAVRNERLTAALAMQEDLRQAGLTDYQLEMESYNKRLELFKEFKLRKEDLEREHAEKMTMINMARLETAADLAGGLAALAKATAGENKKMLKAYQVLATAQATMDTYAAANKAFLTGGGWPWGGVAAAASIAYGLANVAQINGLHFAQGSKSTDAEFGVVPGTAYYGDKVPAMLSSGEMVLSRSEARDYKKGNAGSGARIYISYAPSYTNDVPEYKKAQDQLNFARTMRSVQSDPTTSRLQARMA